MEKSREKLESYGDPRSPAPRRDGADRVDDLLEEMARDIFGEESDKQSRRWLEYWRASRERNRGIFESFERLVAVDFDQATVLDIGCGTGGLASIVGNRGGRYVGSDYYLHVLRAAERDRYDFIQSSADSLPFPSRSCDLIFCFDVIEHLEGGKEWQRRMIQEISRVLSPFGMCFLTTPNFYYPYDAHTQLHGPQFLPRFMRDALIGRLNPNFIREHKSFDHIHLLKPGFLRSALREAGLSPLHQLPCGLDLREYLSLHPVRGALACLGLGWYFHAEFWTVLVHRGARDSIRRKLRKNWEYFHRESPSEEVQGFSPHIDFRRGPFSHQLGSGWHYHEVHEQGCRWTDRRATCYLESKSEVAYINISGFAPKKNRMRVFVDDCWVGEMKLEEKERFNARFLIPFEKCPLALFEIRIESDRTVAPAGDRRRLGLLIFEVGLSS